jgi:hypothetical protein
MTVVSRPIPSEVQILTSEQMRQFCALDPEDACPDFKTPPKEAIAWFEQDLAPLLKARGLARVVPEIGHYLRQYWGFLKNGRLVVQGNFVCQSIVNWDAEGDISDRNPRAKLGKRPPLYPVIVDDAGDCKVLVQFFADDPGGVDPSRDEQTRPGMPSRDGED